MQRYQSPVVNVLQAGSTIAHNLTGGTPTEYDAQEHTASTVYFVGVSQTNVVVASTSPGFASARIFCSIPHTVIQ